jgi:hypothetical protein
MNVPNAAIEPSLQRTGRKLNLGPIEPADA